MAPRLYAAERELINVIDLSDATSRLALTESHPARGSVRDRLYSFVNQSTWTIAVQREEGSAIIAPGMNVGLACLRDEEGIVFTFTSKAGHEVVVAVQAVCGSEWSLIEQVDTDHLREYTP